MTFVVIGVIIWVLVMFVFVALVGANSRVRARTERQAAIRDVQAFRDGHRHQRVATVDTPDGQRPPER